MIPSVSLWPFSKPWVPPFCPQPRVGALIPYTYPPFHRSQIAYAQLSQASFHVNIHLALDSLISSTIWGPLKTKALKWAGLWMASPASMKVVFSPSFSFNEALYRVLHTEIFIKPVRVYHFQTSNFLSHLTAHRWMHAHKHMHAYTGYKCLISIPPDWKRHFYSWAMSDAPVGSIMMRRDGGNQSWEHPDRSWQVSGTAWEGMWGGEVEATQTSPSKIPYTCNHARTQRWSKGNI